MKTKAFTLFRVTLLSIALLQGYVTAAASEVIANPSNSEQLDEDTLKRMLTGRERFWGSGSEVVIAILKDDPRVEEVLTRYSGMSENRFRNHWQRIVYSGRGKMPRLFNDMEDLLKFVRDNEGAIALVPESETLRDFRKIDLSHAATDGRSYLAVR